MDEVLWYDKDIKKWVNKPLMDEKEWADNFLTVTSPNDVIDTCVIGAPRWMRSNEPEPKELVPMLCKRCGGNIVNMTCECCGTKYEWR